MSGPQEPGKLCPSCGTTLPVSANICSNCGYNFNQGAFSQPPGTVGTPPAGYPRDDYAQQSNAADALGIVSLVLGILSLPLICLCYLSIPSGILALVLGAFGLKGRNRPLAIAGMICAGIAVLISLVLVALMVSTGIFSSSTNRNSWR